MRLSRGALMRATFDLQAELEQRIMEGFWARVRRYFADYELRRRLISSRAAQKSIDKGGKP